MIDVAIHKSIRTAIKLGNLQEVIRLVGDDKERLVMDTPFGSWLHVAATHGKLDICHWLVAHGLDVNAYGGTAGGGPLQRAASDGHIDVVKYLLECRSVLDTSAPVRNPLFGAIHGRHTAIAKLLIEHGIDTHISRGRSGSHLTLREQTRKTIG